MITYVIILVIGIAAAIALSIFLSKSPVLRTVLQVVFTILIVVFGYLIVQSILKPIHFNTELDKREGATITKLKDIRTLQVAYKDRYGKYTGSFDTLLTFAKTDSFEIVSLQEIGIWDRDEFTKEQAIKKGIIQVNKAYTPVGDSLFGDSYDFDKLKFVPYCDTLKFKMAAGKLETMSKVKVDVFECYALYEDLFRGMDKQLTINYVEERYEMVNFRGVKVGSLTEATNNAGNWGEN